MVLFIPTALLLELIGRCMLLSSFTYIQPYGYKISINLLTYLLTTVSYPSDLHNSRSTRAKSAAVFKASIFGLLKPRLQQPG